MKKAHLIPEKGTYSELNREMVTSPAQPSLFSSSIVNIRRRINVPG